MRVGLLECDHVGGRFVDVAGDYADMFDGLFRAHAPEVELVRYDTVAGKLPSDPAECEGYVCTGSRASAYDDEAWIHDLAGFVSAARDAEVPFVGVCFGHQMLAHALGGQVERAPTGWGVGIHAVDVLEHAGWMEPGLPTVALQFMHQDQVTALPEGGVLLGRSDHCPVAMFRVGDTMLGLQAHPEFGAAYVDALMAEREERIGADKVEAARRTLSSRTDEGTATKWIARFLAQKGNAA